MFPVRDHDAGTFCLVCVVRRVPLRRMRLRPHETAAAG
jgi:hypothetical protein